MKTSKELHGLRLLSLMLTSRIREMKSVDFYNLTGFYLGMSFLNFVWR